MPVQVVLNRAALTLNVNRDLRARIEERAEERGESMSDVVERAIVHYLDVDDSEVQWTKTVA